MPHADAYSRNGIRHESLPLHLQLLSKHGYLTSSPLPATKHDEDANSSSLRRTGLCVERFLASLSRCSRASVMSESAKHFSLAVINRTNVLKDLLATPTPQSHPRTASFPPRGHPCTLIRLALPSVGRATWIASFVLWQRLMTHGLDSPVARGFIWRHSAASPQEPFACSFHRALLVSTAVCGCDAVLLESACTPVRGTGTATLRVPPTLCRALFPRASGRRLHVVHLDRAPWPCSTVEFALLAGPFLSRLLRVARARLRLVTPAAVAASLTRCLVVSGHHSTISAFC